MCGQSTAADQVIARIARESHGVVARKEMLRAGVTRRQIDWRLGDGRLHRVHPGVYRVGHAAPNLEARYLAAVRAGGEDALLGGPAAAFLFAVIRGHVPTPLVLTSTKRRVRGVTTRRSHNLRDDATTWRGIPVTTVPRTLVDLAAILPSDELARACHEAWVKHHTGPEQIEKVLALRPNTPGAGKLRRILRGDVPVTLSALESRFLTLLREHGLPLPETNRRVGGSLVDCRWPEHWLTVELDGYRYHSSRHAWEQDRRRERETRARGDEFRRYTYGDVFEQPRLMLRELKSLLSGMGARGNAG